MENASKALIIAGAILVSILLISVGILIMNSTSGVTDQVQGQGESMTIQTFNGQFTPYLGNKKSAQQVKSLINLVNSSNATNGNQVNIDYTGKVGETDISATNIPQNAKYDISVEKKGTGSAVESGYNTDGYIYNLLVKVHV